MHEKSMVSPEDQGATFVELFFDLVFVFAITQVTHYQGLGPACRNQPLGIACVGLILIVAIEQVTVRRHLARS